MSADTKLAEPLTEAGTSRFATTKNWQLHYNEAGSGSPVVLLHGSGPGATAWSNFSPNISALSEQHRVIAVDLPGWGKSDPLDPMAQHRSIAHVEALVELLDELGIERASIVGNSMGGLVGMALSAEQPHRVERCVTMGSGIIGPAILTPGGLSEGMRIILETYRDPSPENFRRLVSIMVYDPSFATQELLEQRSAAALEARHHLANFLKPVEAGFAFFRPAPGGEELISRLMQSSTPCLFIHGRDDRVVHWETSLRAVSFVPDSSMHLVNRCGHWMQLEHAEAFNALVTGFLAQPRAADANPVTPSAARNF
jgi:2-hydroxy-6-oxonona-2,4-dienedioate hydrolase